VASTVTLVCVGCFLLVAGLIAAKRFESAIGVWLTKPLASLAFVAVALLGNQEWTLFQGLLVLGFLLCLLGDVLLIPASKAMFLGGLVAFLLGHLAYIAAFSQVLVFHWSMSVPLLLCIFLNLGVYRWLRNYIGIMKLPIITYMLVITCMVLAAFGVYANDTLPHMGRVLILAGAIGFYFSDLFVVREQFVSKSFLNPLIGLPLYYTSQLGLALSLGYMHT
jgi:uncharacterized membrane protein YhhN